MNTFYVLQPYNNKCYLTFNGGYGEDAIDNDVIRFKSIKGAEDYIKDYGYSSENFNIIQVEIIQKFIKAV